MTSRRYQLRLKGLKESQGEIKANRLIGVLRGLAATAARATQLRATGSGRTAKRTPKWIESTTDFTVTGIASGSTTVGIDAPCLRTTAYDQFSQLPQWGEKADLDDTALDLATEAINEAAAAESVGNCFDDAVLGAILKLKNAGCNSGVEVELSLAGSKHNKFALDDNFFETIAAKRKKIPPSKAFIVCGCLDEIRHANGYFRLIMQERIQLFGRLSNPSSHLELLRSLWGEKVTLEGMVNFKGNGEPRFIETRKIRKYAERDALFEEVPKGDPANLREFIVDEVKKKRTTKLTDFIGLWPGDETAEELLAELKG